MLFTVPLGIAGGIYMAEYAGIGRLTTRSASRRS